MAIFKLKILFCSPVSKKFAKTDCAKLKWSSPAKARLDVYLEIHESAINVQTSSNLITGPGKLVQMKFLPRTHISPTSSYRCIYDRFRLLF